MSFVANNTNWDALLQEQYQKNQIISAINIATPFREELKRTGMTSGRERVYGLQVGASQGVGARAEGGNNPQYGAGEYQDVVLKAKYNYATLKITGQAEEFSNKDAFTRFGLRILKDTKEGLKLTVGRQCWGDGQGTLALVNGALLAGATVITVDSPFGVLWGSTATLTTFLVKRKMAVQFGSDDNNGQGYQVASVGSTTFTLQANTPLLNAVADNALISMVGSANLEIEGILKFAATSSFMTSTLGFANGIYHGIDRSLFPEWEGNVINFGAALSLPLIRSLRDAIYKRTDDEESNFFMCSTEMSADYEALLQPGQRFVPATRLEGGHTIMEHDGLRISKDSRAPIKAIFLGDKSTVTWAQTRDPHWYQDGGGILQIVPGQDGKQGLLKWYANLDCEEPRRFGIGYNVTHN